MKGFRIFRIFGISTEIHVSWLVLFYLFVWVIAGTILPGVVPNQPVIYYWLFAIGSALILFSLLLAHELGHSLMARRFNILVERITLFALGGAAQSKGKFQSAKAEFWVAIAGPFVSFISAIIFGALAKLLNVGVPLLTASLTYIAFLNLIWVVFNLLPGYPMDGGRILKAAIWAISKDELKAMKWAVRCGQFFGVLFIGWGVYSFLVTANFFALWPMLIGGLLIIWSQREYQGILVEKSADKFQVKEVMEPLNIDEENSCGPNDNLKIILEKMRKEGCTGLYVMERGRLIGVVTLATILKYIKK